MLFEMKMEKAIDISFQDLTYSTGGNIQIQ